MDLNIDMSFPIEELEFFLLILTRISMFVFAAPFFGRSEVPRTVKASFAVLLSILLYTGIQPHVYPQYSTLLGYSTLVIKESITGLLIGLAANWSMQIAAFAGQIVDTNIGFSMSAQLDPSTQMNVTVTGNFYQYGFMLVFMATGMHRFLVQAMAESFTLIPIGKAVFDLEGMYRSFLDFMAQYVMLGFKIGLPVFSVTLLLNGLLGIMAKVSPQMNMFAVGVQIKAIVGLSVLFLTVSLLPAAADLVFDQMKTAIVSFIEAMGGGA
ncbi:MAG: flagellar biosynthetic protein FliR [Lachnospiraceae bacterium]|nr:flagellar biosynthetic protein FliR [Lachnospiraceae bacterium]